MTKTLTGVALLVVVPQFAVAQGYAGVPAAPQKEEQQVETLQEHIEARPDVADEVRQLQSDPEFQDVLNDPEIRKALESGDTATLLANPKINNLTNHPAVQDITKRLSE